jgi:two-component sensor histidine kinase
VKKGSITGNSRELRKKAEAFLGRDSTGTEDQKSIDAKTLLHELSVHQVELELQNQELKEARDEAERMQVKYFSLYDLAPIGYAGFTLQGQVADINLAGAEMVGEQRNRIVNSRFQLFIAQRDIPVFNDFLLRVFRNGIKTKCEVQLERDGQPLAIVRIEGVLVEQKPEKNMACRAAIIDITDQRNAERDIISRNEDLLSLNRKLEEAGADLRYKQDTLTQSLAETEALLDEVNHRVKNNLSAFISLLSLKGSHEDTPEGQRLKTDLINRAQSMALIHETLYRTKKFSSVAGSVQVHVYAGGVVLDIARATPCGLIINELITNSFKYAFPATFDCMKVRGRPCIINVSLKEVEGICTLSISDNGIGMPGEVNPRNAKSLGLSLVKFLAKHQLRAETKIHNKDGTGFSFRFVNPRVSSE